jgi:hypothetical protein
MGREETMASKRSQLYRLGQFRNRPDSAAHRVYAVV